MSILVQHLNKSFANTKVLDDVNFTIESGRIHMLLGANGSGKSTLIKMLTGIYQPDGGIMVVGGEKLNSISSPNEAKRFGIRVVHQESPLIDSLTVAECVALFRGYPKGKLGRIHWSKLENEVSELFKRLHLPISPRAITGQISAAERAMVSLAIALDGAESQTKLLILDEADATIQESETEFFLERVKLIAQTGIPVLMITHRLKQVTQMGDDVTILSNGRVVFSGAAKNITESFIIEKMIGNSDITHLSADESDHVSVKELWKASGRTDSPLLPKGNSLDVRHLSGELLKDVSFQLKPGEIVGIAGLADSGIHELSLMLSGAKKIVSGEIIVNGTKLPKRFSPAVAIRSGITLLPADRHRQGGIALQSVEENIIVPDTKRYWHQRKRRILTVNRLFDILDVRPRERNKLFGALSGGNQQKVILGKWLLLKPSVLILEDPTQGVDPGARQKIYAALQDAAKQGVSFLFSTTEPEQLALLCERVIILHKGEIIKELNREDNSLTREAVMRWYYI